MSGEYLPVEQSVGYINLKKAFEYMFGYFPKEINESDFENFGFITDIQNKEFQYLLEELKKTTI